MLKEEIKSLINTVIPIKVDFDIEEPEKEMHGDYATNVALILAKQLKGDPIKFAQQIEVKLTRLMAKKGISLFEKIEVAKPGFINFFLKPEFLQSQLKEILKEGDDYGKQTIGKGKTVVIDFSSPNIAKPMHVGHLRSTIIGQAICNIYKALGYNVVGDNHLGDWGTQFGIIIAAYKKYKSLLKGEKITVKKMLEIYVKFNAEIEKKPELQEIAKEEFRKLEQGDKENRKIWKILKKESLKEFDKIYKLLGIGFDTILGESFYEKYSQKIIEKALKKKVAVQNSDGSIIIPLDKFNLPPFLIQKSDGATLYGLRDLAAIKYRVKKYDPEKIIYVVGNEQSLYFEQLFRAADLLGYFPYDKLVHVKFGLVLDENKKKLATRAGRFISAKELIDKIIKLAERVIKEKNPKLSKKEVKKIAKIIGIGALKYADLSQNRQTNIIFDWKKILSLEGNSGPYLLYSYVRLKSILKKAKTRKLFFKRLNPELLTENEEIEILKELIKFPEKIEEAGINFQINLLANYLYNLASLVNAFYEQIPVIKAEKDLKISRLALIDAALIVLQNGLNLLGIETSDRM